MKRRTYILVLIAALFLLLSCSKDKEENPYHFTEISEITQFLSQFDWRLFVDIENLENGMMELSVDVDRRGATLDLDDTYSLTVNGNSLSYEPHPIFSNSLYFGPIELPPPSDVKVILKRQDEVLFDKSVRLAAIPQITSFPDNPDWSKDITVKWNLSRNSHVQILTADTNHYDESQLRDYPLSPSARSFTIPANDLYMEQVSSYFVGVYQFNFSQYKNNILCSMTLDYVYNIEDEEGDEPSLFVMKERLLKKGR